MLGGSRLNSVLARANCGEQAVVNIETHTTVGLVATFDSRNDCSLALRVGFFRNELQLRGTGSIQERILENFLAHVCRLNAISGLCNNFLKSSLSHEMANLLMRNESLQIDFLQPWKV